MLSQPFRLVNEQNDLIRLQHQSWPHSLFQFKQIIYLFFDFANESMPMASMASTPASALATDRMDAAGDFHLNPMLGDSLAYIVQVRFP